MKLPNEAQKLSTRELLVNERPIGNKTGDRLGRLRFANHVVPVEEHSSGSRFQDSHHHADRGGFACAIGTEKAEYLSCGDFQIEPVHGGQFAVALGEIDELNHDDFGFAISDFRFTRSLRFLAFDRKLLDWNQHPQRKCIVIPGKLAIASATRKPGSSNPSGYQLEFILHLAKVWYNGSFRIIEKCKI
jgi:hypothetical protein